MGIYKTEAIVINKFDFRETSIIANFYTRDFGKISGILKGIRKEPKKFASSLEPFSLNEIIFYRKTNTTLHLVSQCDIKNNFHGIRQDMLKAGAGGIVTEIIHAVMPQEDVNAEIFDLTLEVLRELEANRETERITTIFKIKMLALSGFKPHFDSCVCCGSKIFTQSRFSVIMGGLLCPQCSAKDLKARSIFRGTIATVLHIERSPFRNALTLGMNPQIKKELDFILNAFLDFHLGKKLKSESVVEALKAVSLAVK